MVIPSFELSTEKARSVLPDTYSRKDAVYNIQRSALTIAALTTGNWALIREGMRDRIHQPYRAKLIPGLEEILSLEIKGLLGVALSGAGPTVFAFADPRRSTEIGSALAAVGVWESFGCADLVPSERGWLVLEVNTDGLHNVVDRDITVLGTREELEARLAAAFTGWVDRRGMSRTEDQ